MKLNWEPKYSKHDKVNPESYSIKVPFDVCLHHHIYYDKDEWLFSCRTLNIMGKQLFTKDIDKAEELALKIIKDYIVDLVDKYNQLVGGAQAE